MNSNFSYKKAGVDLDKSDLIKDKLVNNVSSTHNKNVIKIANSVEPDKKPRSSMAPTIVFKDDQLVGVLGSPGGSRIICYVSKTLFYLINFKLSIEEAINLPHLCSRNSFSEIEETDSKSLAT